MNTGVIIPHVGPSQLTEEVLEAAKYPQNVYSIFYEHETECYRAIPHLLSNVSESLIFTGRLIATSLSSAKYVIKSLNHVQRIFYVYDLEFLREGKNNYIANLEIYRHPSLKLYTRCEDYADRLRKYANVDVEVDSIYNVMNGEVNVET